MTLLLFGFQEDEENELGANLVAEAVKGHRVRHLKEKVEKLDPVDPVVEAILAKFCFETRLVLSNHRDRSIHLESACQLCDVKMTRPGLLHLGLTSAD